MTPAYVDATLQVTINGTMVATGKTNSSGQSLLVANVTSRDQLMALIKKEVAITAPSGACGGTVPAAAAGRKLAAAADPSSDDDDVKIIGLGMSILDGDSNFVDQLVDDILNSPPVDDDHLPAEIREDIMAFLDQDSVTIDDLSNFIEDSELGRRTLLNAFMDFLGIPSN
jgi:hypothetical protein